MSRGQASSESPVYQKAGSGHRDMQAHGHPDQCSRGKPRRKRHTDRQEQERHHPDRCSRGKTRCNRHTDRQEQEQYHPDVSNTETCRGRSTTIRTRALSVSPAAIRRL